MNLDRAVDLVSTVGGRAQLCVWHDGDMVLDRAFGVDPDTPFLLFSAGKPFLAVLVHQLAEQGRLSLDDPVAGHWPEFAAHGKHGITVRHVLQHRSGLPFVHSVLRDALIATNWGRSVRALAAARPHFPPGQGPAYQVLSYGFLLGELVQRVTGEPLREVLRHQLLEPFGLRHTHLGTPREAWRHRIRVRGTGPRQLMFNRRAVREAPIPAATVSSSARDLALFYSVLVNGSALHPETLAEACRPTTDGEPDRVLHRPVRWSQGFQLGGPAEPPRAMGRLSSPRTFGHNGSYACFAWADPDRRLVLAYTTDRLPPNPMVGTSHLSALSDAVLAEFT